ncbi:hypothetical protein BDR07DRAFT_1424069 [Suillus spraguei]|nr:hypothetical protein BDR07DRAFT_1424069 [Suillus spraguei]
MYLTYTKKDECGTNTATECFVQWRFQVRRRSLLCNDFYRPILFLHNIPTSSICGIDPSPSRFYNSASLHSCVSPDQYYHAISMSIPSHRNSPESLTGRMMIFFPAFVLDVQLEFFTFVAILANLQSGHPGHILLVFV